MFLGGLEGIPQQTLDRGLDFGRLILKWLENPAHWWPAVILIVAIGVWRGTLGNALKAIAEVIRAIRGKNGKPDVDKDN